MKAIDTNIVARFILNDDPVQSPLARAQMSAGAYIPLTVLLESAWLLTSRYRLSREVTAAALRAIVDLPAIVIDSADLVLWALGRFEQGADIADMIHIVASEQYSAFLSFETRLAYLAGPDSPLPVETLA